MEPKYGRVIMKISGEALMSENSHPLDFDIVNSVAKQIIDIADMGVQMGIIVGGGNIWRGRSSGSMDRVQADHMGMLATVINALALQDALEQQGKATRVQTAIEMRQVAEPYIRRRALRHLEKNRIVIFACGTGNPYFSTDTGTTLRAIEIEADAILLAKAIDGVYDKDPKVYPDAVKYDQVSIQNVVDQRLQVVDLTATIMCLENKMPMVVFGLNEKDSIIETLYGKFNGTYVTVDE